MLGGRYLVGERLGRGGVAVVYRVEDRTIGVQRALKVIDQGAHIDALARDALRGRLHSEAQAMARLKHPHVVAIHDVGEEDGFDWVVMDLADGGTLAERVEAGAVPVADAVRWTAQVLEALAAAHAEGIVHRDVKPQNVLLDRYGNAQLADFGIALIDSEVALRSTRTGTAMGSLAYMAPEQRMDARGVTPAADVYAAGATLYHVLTKKSPMDLFMAGEHSDRLADLPLALRTVVVTATRYEPQRRYGSALAMRAALTDAFASPDEPPVAPSASAPAPASPPPATRPADASPEPDYAPAVWPTWAGWAVAAALLLAVGGGGLLVAARPTGSPLRVRAPGAEPSATSSVDRVLATAMARPLGIWHGSSTSPAGHNEPFTLDLAGSLDQVTGSVRTRRANGHGERPVSGRYTPATRTLTLSEPDVPGDRGGTWTLVFDDALASFTGRFQPNDGLPAATVTGG